MPRFKTLIDLMENLKEIIKEADNTINQYYKENPCCSTIRLVPLSKDVNVETFAKWKGIKITYKGGKSGTVTKQSVAAGEALSKTKKITITLGD